MFGELMGKHLHVWHFSGGQFAMDELSVNIHFEGTRGVQTILDVVAEHKDQETIEPRRLLKLLDDFWDWDTDGLADGLACNHHHHE